MILVGRYTMATRHRGRPPSDTKKHYADKVGGSSSGFDLDHWLQDAYLPQRLVDKLMYMYNYIEMARVTGVPMSFLLTKGQSIKVFSQLLRKAKQRSLVIPFARVRKNAHDSIDAYAQIRKSHANNFADVCDASVHYAA